jgi:hypothetical protein
MQVKGRKIKIKRHKIYKTLDVTISPFYFTFTLHFFLFQPYLPNIPDSGHESVIYELVLLIFDSCPFHFDSFSCL